MVLYAKGTGPGHAVRVLHQRGLRPAQRRAHGRRRQRGRLGQPRAARGRDARSSSRSRWPSRSRRTPRCSTTRASPASRTCSSTTGSRSPRARACPDGQPSVRRDDEQHGHAQDRGDQPGVACERLAVPVLHRVDEDVLRGRQRRHRDDGQQRVRRQAERGAEPPREQRVQHACAGRRRARGPGGGPRCPRSAGPRATCRRSAARAVRRRHRPGGTARRRPRAGPTAARPGRGRRASPTMIGLVRVRRTTGPRRRGPVRASSTANAIGARTSSWNRRVGTTATASSSRYTASGSPTLPAFTYDDASVPTVTSAAGPSQRRTAGPGPRRGRRRRWTSR